MASNQEQGALMVSLMNQLSFARLFAENDVLCGNASEEVLNTIILGALENKMVFLVATPTCNHPGRSRKPRYHFACPRHTELRLFLPRPFALLLCGTLPRPPRGKSRFRNRHMWRA